MASPTDIQESAQALFCALANKHGVSNIDKTFNKESYPTYLDFKEFWNKKYKSITIEKAFATHVKSGKASLQEIEDLLHGMKESSKSKKNDWYYSSLQIAKQLIKEIDSISNKFNYVKSGDWSNIFWRHGDSEVMENIAKLYKKANDYQKLLVVSGSQADRPFDNINKWSTADIYFASETAKKQIEEMVKEKKLDFTKLNSFVSKTISEGTLLPLSLKKQPNEVTIKKVNFNRPQEQKNTDKLEYSGTEDWKVFNPEKDDINKYKRTLILYMSKDKKMTLQLRHDASTEIFKGVVAIPGSGAFEGSISAGGIRDMLKTVDTNFAKKWYDTYDSANIKFRERKSFLDKELKAKDRKRYEEEREKASALVTNEINPLIIQWLNKNSENADLFVRAIYTYATARSGNSAKYVIAK
jgi:hypothetical protein